MVQQDLEEWACIFQPLNLFSLIIPRGVGLCDFFLVDDINLKDE